MLSITRSFAYAFAPRGVRVNAVVPGIIDTPDAGRRSSAKVAEFRHSTPEEMSRARNATIPLGRTGSPEESRASSGSCCPPRRAT